MALVPGRRLWPAVAATGLVTGAVSVFPYQGGGGVLHVLGHSAALWLAVAFGFGAAAGGTRRGAVAGLVSLLAVVVGFYAVMQLVNPGYRVVHTALFWLGAALIGGPAYGAIGARWRHGSERARGVAAAAMGAAFLAESVLFRTPQAVRIGEGLVGIAVAVILARRRAPLFAAAAAFPVFLIAGLAGWVLTKYAAHLYFVPDHFGQPPPPRP